MRIFTQYLEKLRTGTTETSELFVSLAANRDLLYLCKLCDTLV